MPRIIRHTLALTTGTRLGVYEIRAAIGEGGMGRVFRARDTRLNREVALKVLPDSFATDRDRVARFTGEAKTLASLNHPHIAAIYGLEEQGGIQALVMELVAGEDLSTLIGRGPLPSGDAVAIARQIVEALDAAHEQGIVHRDLKPANIKVRDDGTVKVLDFGLAKGMEATPASVTAPATAMGMVLGTAAYMSPEQARGRPVDRRTDIWAFGVILFEMLTGRPLFASESTTDTLAAVISRDIDWSTLPPGTPPAVKRVLVRCLERDPKKRLRDIGDARWDLDAVADGDHGALVSGTRRKPTALIPWLLALAGLGAAGWMAWTRPAAGRADGVTYTNFGLPRDVEPVATLATGFGISPDGRQVFMVGVRGGLRRLFLRSLDSLEVTEITDPAGVNGAAFSPDSRSLALLVGGGVVTRMSVADRQRSVVSNTADISGGVAWGDAGILFSRNGALWIAPVEGGGAPRALTTIDAARHEVQHDGATMLPGGRIVLFSSLSSDPATDRIEAVTIGTGARSVVVERATTPVFAAPNHLLFARDGAIFAVPIDPESAVVRGAAVPVIRAGLVDIGSTGRYSIRLSPSGTLVMVPAGYNAKKVWSVGRDGSALPLVPPAGRYINPRVSPDSRRLILEKDGTEIAVLDFARETFERLSPPAYGTNFSTWNASSDRVIFRRFNAPVWIAADGSGKTSQVPSTYINNYPAAPGPDPDSVFMVRVMEGSSGDVFLLSMTGAFEPKPIVSTPGYDGGPTLSPDGRWLVFMSTMSGQAEAYVKPYPALDRQWPVSAGGGTQVRWSRDGREIYYRSNQHFVAVPFDGSGSTPIIGKPTKLFEDSYEFGSGISIPNYDVTRDGRFIVIKREAGDSGLQIAVNWISELRRTLAAGGVH